MIMYYLLLVHKKVYLQKQLSEGFTDEARKYIVFLKCKDVAHSEYAVYK